MGPPFIKSKKRVLDISKQWVLNTCICKQWILNVGNKMVMFVQSSIQTLATSARLISYFSWDTPYHTSPRFYLLICPNIIS